MMNDDPLSDLNCARNDDAVCPHCGYQYEDTWDFFTGHSSDRTVTTDCDNCEREFEIEAITETVYTTRRL